MTTTLWKRILMSHDFSLASKKKGEETRSICCCSMECAPCKRSWWSHTHAPTRLYTFSTTSAAKKKDHVTFNRKCGGVLNRRDDERENISICILSSLAGERETKKDAIKNIQMRSVCAARRWAYRGPLSDKRNVCRLAEVLFKRIFLYIGSTPWRTYFSLYFNMAA